MSRINGGTGPAEIPVQVADAKALKGQYIRHVDSEEIFKIADVGQQGVTVFKADGFGGPAGGQEILVTWNSLKYKHRIMVHVADIETKPGDLN